MSEDQDGGGAPPTRPKGPPPEIPWRFLTVLGVWLLLMVSFVGIGGVNAMAHFPNDPASAPAIWKTIAFTIAAIGSYQIWATYWP